MSNEQIDFAAAYNAGFVRGASWVGPNGDGTLGQLSLAFVREDAERCACGYEFRALTDGPSDHEVAMMAAYMRGFNAARV